MNRKTGLRYLWYQRQLILDCDEVDCWLQVCSPYAAQCTIQPNENIRLIWPNTPLGIQHVPISLRSARSLTSNPQQAGTYLYLVRPRWFHPENCTASWQFNRNRLILPNPRGFGSIRGPRRIHTSHSLATKLATNDNDHERRRCGR